MKRVGVLALQGAFAEHIKRLQELDVEAREVRLPSHLAEVDALIIPGGESTTIGKLLTSWGLVEPIRERAHAGMPIYGTCAGMILLAKRASGGEPPLLGLMDIDVKRNAFGRQIDSFEQEIAIAPLGEPPFRAVFIRAPLVEAIGANVEVLGRLSDGNYAGGIVAAQQGNLLVSAFHPELTEDTRFHRYFISLIPE